MQLKQFVDCEAGATAIEYGMIAAIMVVVVISSGGSIRTAIAGLFGGISNSVVSAN